MSAPKIVASSATGRRTVIASRLDLDEKIALAPSRAIRRPSTAKHQPRLTDGIKHPVTVRRVS